MEKIQSGIEWVSTYGPMIIASAAAAATALPQGEPGTLWGKVRAVIDFLALNFGNAKNAK